MTVSASRSSSRTSSTRRKKARPARDLAQEVTDKIVAALEAGVIPWRAQHTAADAGGIPSNLATGKEYRGINVFLLWIAGLSGCRTRPLWLTYKQAAALGGQVRAGEKGTGIVFCGVREKKDSKAPDGVKRIPFLKSFTVFNVDQVDGLPGLPEKTAPPAAAAPGLPTPERVACEEIIQHYLRGARAPRVAEMDVTPHYTPRTDSIVTPPMASFETPAAYFGTLFHEMAHSTGHASRLARPGIVNAGTGGRKAYAAEEMVAELAAALVCAHAGIAPQTEEMSAAYIGGWLDAVQEDKGFFLKAAGAAQKAVDLMRPGVAFEEA